MYRFILIVTMILNVSVWGVVTDPDKLRYTLREDFKNGFAIEVPRDWPIIPNKTASLVIAAPQDRTTELFRPSLNIIVDQVDEKATLSELFDANVKNASAVLNQFRILSIDQEMISGVAAQQMVYSCRLYRNGTYLVLKNTALCILKDRLFYIITCSTLVDQYDKYNPLFMRLIDSLRLFFPGGRLSQD